MWKITNDDNGDVKMITMTAGDTPCFKINCNVIGEDGSIEPYVPESGDQFVFACKQNASDTSYLFKIVIPNNTMLAQFTEANTKNLKNGKYIWEVSLNKPSIDYHCTFISEKILKITTEVY